MLLKDKTLVVLSWDDDDALPHYSEELVDKDDCDWDEDFWNIWASVGVWFVGLRGTDCLTGHEYTLWKEVGKPHDKGWLMVCRQPKDGRFQEQYKHWLPSPPTDDSPLTVAKLHRILRANCEIPRGLLWEFEEDNPFSWHQNSVIEYVYCRSPNNSNKAELAQKDIKESLQHLALDACLDDTYELSDITNRYVDGLSLESRVFIGRLLDVNAKVDDLGSDKYKESVADDLVDLLESGLDEVVEAAWPRFLGISTPVYEYWTKYC